MTRLILAVLLAVLVALYLLGWGQAGWWPYVPPTALLYLVPVAVSALYFGRRDGLIVAGAAVGIAASTFCWSSGLISNAPFGRSVSARISPRRSGLPSGAIPPSST